MLKKILITLVALVAGFFVFISLFLAVPQEKNTGVIIDNKIGNIEKAGNPSEQIKYQEEKIKDLEKEIRTYQGFVNDVTNMLGEKELKILAEKEWKYYLRINDKLISSNEIEITARNFNISLSEERRPYQILKQEIMDKGKISGIYYKHMNIISQISYTTYGADGTVVTSSIYTFNNVKKGTIIKLELSLELQERLKLSSSEVLLRVK